MLRSAFSVLALFMWLPACNSILGMERAHLDEGDASTPSGVGGRTHMQGGTGGAVRSSDTPLPDCTTTSDECMQCLDQSSCHNVVTDCLAKDDCRGTIERHTTCLANYFCGSEANCESVLEKQVYLASCYPNDCKDACAGKGIVPICKLYCSCMQSVCTAEFKQYLGGTYDDCVAACSAPGSIKDNALCREVHCELAIDYGTDPHCSHAVGMTGQCTAKIPICLAGKVNSGLGPCTTGDDCCSGKCQQHICVTAQ